MGFVIEALRQALDQLADTDPAVLGDPAAMVELHRELARMEAVVTRAAAAFDASKEWQADGGQTAAAWLATRCRLPRGTARRRVSLGRKIRLLPVCEEAWLAGRITGAHASTIAGVLRPHTAAAMARDEPLLVGNATSASKPSCGPWRTGTSWPTRTAPTSASRPVWPGATCTSSRPSAVCGWAR